MDAALSDRDTSSPELSFSGNVEYVGPTIFALIIGINRYTGNYVNLTWAVSDADRFENFLTDNLKVPKDHIISLRDERAARVDILHGFEALEKDTRIFEDQAAIIIYYAGHGARVVKPKEWVDWVTPDGYIEQICPSDIGVTGNDGQVVQGLPDRTVSALLDRLSVLKGNNITLILDCCSSGGLNRDFGLGCEGCVPRRILNPPPIQPDCDKELLARIVRYAHVAKGFSGKYYESHVLLAACGRDELAWEDNKGGCFTDALLACLTRYGVNHLTYTSLMHVMAIPRNKPQTPHCEGRHKNRRLFNKNASGADNSFILSRRLGGRESKKALLQAGASLGITLGSTFNVHCSNLKSDFMLANNPLDDLRLTVVGVNAFSSELELVTDASSFEIPPKFYSQMVQFCAPEFNIFCEDQVWLQALFPPDITSPLSLNIVNDPEKALLLLSIDGNDNVLFKHNDPMITPYIGPCFRYTCGRHQIERIYTIVAAYVCFRCHLTRTGPDHFDVRMELNVLDERYNVEHGRVLRPHGKNLIAEEPATIVVDERAKLGMTLVNLTNQSLYPHLFYFDPSELVILNWYNPPVGCGTGGNNAIDHPLLPRSSFTIGYGSGGGNPWQFHLRDGDDKDLGFFKLFLTTSAVDLSCIEQASPFTKDDNLSRDIRASAEADLPEMPKWGSKLSTIIQLARIAT